MIENAHRDRGDAEGQAHVQGEAGRHRPGHRYRACSRSTRTSLTADSSSAIPTAWTSAISCVAIGNPFGLGQTVTSGIVSALGRTGLGIEGYEDFIQTDASINPGNSGGALVNLAGELIGINTAIIGPSGGNVGIGFAVPCNMVRTVMEQIISFGEMRRGRLGVAIQDVTPDLAERWAWIARAAPS